MTVSRSSGVAYGRRPTYGQINITNNADGIALTAATPADLSDSASYVQVTGVFDALPHGINVNVTQQTSSMVVNRSGDYHIALWSTVSADQNNTNVAFRFAVNGVIGLQRRPRTKITVAQDRRNLVAHGFVSLNKGDVVTLWIAADKTCDAIIEDAVFSIEEIRPR